MPLQAARFLRRIDEDWGKTTEWDDAIFNPLNVKEGEAA